MYDPTDDERATIMRRLAVVQGSLKRIVERLGASDEADHRFRDPVGSVLSVE
jgi:hypothetical protein